MIGAAISTTSTSQPYSWTPWDLSDEVCVVVVTDSALVAGKDTDDHFFYL